MSFHSYHFISFHFEHPDVTAVQIQIHFKPILRHGLGHHGLKPTTQASERRPPQEKAIALAICFPYGPNSFILTEKALDLTPRALEEIPRCLARAR